MKTIKRRLLSLVLAMAMVLTLAPGALAENSPDASGGNPGDTTPPTTPPALSNITVNGGGDNKKVSETYSLTVSPTPTDAANVTYGWSVSSGGISVSAGSGDSVTVSCKNTNSTTDVTGVVKCTATQDSIAKEREITLTFKGIPAPTTPVATGVTITPTTAVSVEVGKDTNLTATVAGDTGVSQTVTWSSDNSSIAAVNPSTGVVTGKAVGTAKITATSEAKDANGKPVTATKDVAVTASTAATTISFSPTSLSLTAGGAAGTVTVTVKQGNTPVVGQTVTIKSVSTTPITGVINSATLGSTPTTNANGQATITVTPGTVVGNGIISVTCDGKDASFSVNVASNTNVVATLSPYSGTPANGTTIYLDNWSDYNNANYRAFTLTPGLKVGGIPATITSTSYQWTLNGYNVQNNNVSNPNSYTLYATNSYLKYGTSNNVLKCEATIYYKQDGVAESTNAEYVCYINTGYAANALASATVSTSTSSYALGDVDDAGKSSIVSQLDSYFYNKTGYYGLAYVQFTGSLQNNTYGSLSARSGVNYYADRRSGTGTSYSYLSDVLFYPGNTKGTVTFPIRAYYYTSNTLNTTNWTDGSITFNVTEGVSSSGDITYTADLGKDVAFDLRDFEDYYYNKTRGTLSYVTFTLPSGGTLYYDGGRLPSSNSCYASPSRTQIDLAGIYFTPTGTTATRPGSVRINFTAYGSRNYSGGTSGTVVINYLSGSAKDITYTPSGKSVSLRASDFTEAYRQAVGSTAPSGLTIQFQDVPSYGTLTYKDSSRSNSSTVTLRSSNIKNYKFTTRSSGSNQLADVTYTPSGSRNESITYIAYNGNTPQFTGKVVFNPTVVDNNMSVTFTGGQTITLDYQRFVQANASVMASTTRIRFMSLPVYGTLTYNGATVSAAGTDIVPSLLGNVVYRSSSATTVTDKVVFTCYNAAGDVVGGGQVNLNSTGTGGNNGGVTNISQFKDVNPNAWYASDLSILLSRGIMQGKLEGKFDPLGQLKYGEALKIFLLSAGYSAQEGTGKDWAAGYKTLAVNNGWISSDVDLDAKITRNAMAELAAKVLGLSATSSVPPAWKDGTSNGYANALYYTSPQILVGNADGTFKGNDTLQRQEICKIAARVLNYKSNQQSSQLPGWLS